METGPALAPASTAADGAPVDGIQCDASEQVAYHIHSHLLVFVNGQPRSLPYGIGLVEPVAQKTGPNAFAHASRCCYWLHVHPATESSTSSRPPSRLTRWASSSRSGGNR